MLIPFLEWAASLTPPLHPNRARQLRVARRIKGLRKKRSRYFISDTAKDPRRERGYWGQLRNKRRRRPKGK